MKKISFSVIVLTFLLASCGSPTIVWQPPFLPIAVAFSKDGVEFEFQLGIDIPYVGAISLEVPFEDEKNISRVLYVVINDTAHQYDIGAQDDKKFEGIICSIGCKVDIDLAQNGNITLFVKDISSAKNAMVFSDHGNFNLSLIVNVGAANIREGPGLRYNEIGGAYRGNVLNSDGIQQVAANGVIWYRIIVPPGNYASGKVGWISSNCVQIE